MTKKRVPIVGKSTVEDPLTEEMFLVSYGGGGSDRKHKAFPTEQKALDFYAERLKVNDMPRLWAKQEIEFVARIKK